MTLVTLNGVTNSDSINAVSEDNRAIDNSNIPQAERSTSTSKGTETIPVRMADASTSKVRIFPANLRSDNDLSQDATEFSDRPLIVMWPGWGMGARYYDPIGRELASRGFNVATGELHGQGSNTAKASRVKKWGYHDMASQDYPRTIQAAKERFGLAEDHPVILLCHSMGGQIGSLFLARPEATELNVRGMVGVGAGTPFYKGFSGTTRYRLQFGAPVMRAISNIIGYQPAGKLDLAGYGRQSGTHIKEWYRLSRTNRFLDLSGADLDYETAMQQVTIPILLLRFRNDYDCTTRSARNLASLLPKATQMNGRSNESKNSGPVVETIEDNLGHNRWARQPERVTARIEEFLSELEM